MVGLGLWEEALAPTGGQGGNEGNLLLCIVLIKVYQYLWPLNPPFWIPQEQVKCVSVFKDGNRSHSGLFKLTFEKKISQR